MSREATPTRLGGRSPAATLERTSRGHPSKDAIPQECPVISSSMTTDTKPVMVEEPPSGTAAAAVREVDVPIRAQPVSKECCCLDGAASQTTANLHLNMQANELRDSGATALMSPGVRETEYSAGEAGRTVETDGSSEGVEMPLEGLVDLALCSFDHCDYSTSLAYFRKILHSYPACSAEIRMWIGHCCCKLGNFDRANTAYLRVLQLDPHCAGGMVGLALLMAREEKLTESLSFLKAALAESPADATAALLTFRDDFCLDVSLDFSLSISKFVLETSRDDHLRSSFAWAVAKRYHVLEKYDLAFDFYQTASEHASPEFVLPLYGLGQLYMQRSDFQKAAECFEQVLDVDADCVDAMRLLGLIYNQTGRREKRHLTRTYLEHAVEVFPDDCGALVKLAEELEAVDPDRSLALYLSAYESSKPSQTQDNQHVPLLNNIGALCFSMRDYEQSQKYLTLAREELDSGPQNSAANSTVITLLYNSGRISESLSDLKAAETCYLSVLATHPAYSDACMRLGHVAAANGDLDEADAWFTEAAELNPDNPEPWILQGDLLCRRKDYAAACDRYEMVLKNPCHADETYVMLKLGNTCVDIFRQGVVDPGRRKILIEKAFSNFQQVLRLDPTNPYAVNGMGVVLASTGFGNAALEMFLLVQECDPHVVDACLNVGHMRCAQKDYTAAVEVYQRCASNWTGAPDSNIHAYLARACYLGGELKRAERSLQIALRMAPGDMSYKFDFGLVLKAAAISTLKERNSSLAAVENAVADLRTAETIFKELLVESDKGLDEKRLRKEAAVTFNFLNQSASHLERAERLDAQAAKKQKRTANQLLLTDQFPIRKNDSGKREAASASSSGTKGKMARQQVKTEDGSSPLKKRNHKNALLEESLVDFKQIVSNAQREPQRKRVKAVGDGNNRRRKRFADRKRRELEIERNTVVSSDEDPSPKFRPVRRRFFGPQSLLIGKKISHLHFDGSSDVCSSVDLSENDMFVFSVRLEPQLPCETSSFSTRRPACVSQKRGQSSSEKPMLLKRFVKSRSDEAISVPVDIPAVQKKNLSDGDASPVTVSIGFTGKNQPVPSVTETAVNETLTCPVSCSLDSDDSAKRYNTDSEPESRKRRSSLHPSDAGDEK